MSLASHIALLEDPFSSGGKVGSRFLNADLSDRLGIWSAVVNRAVTYILLVIHINYNYLTIACKVTIIL